MEPSAPVTASTAYSRRVSGWAETLRTITLSVACPPGEDTKLKNERPSTVLPFDGPIPNVAVADDGAPVDADGDGEGEVAAYAAGEASSARAINPSRAAKTSAIRRVRADRRRAVPCRRGNRLETTPDRTAG